MLLLDGISHTAQIRSRNQVKYFKYPISLLRKITVSFRKEYADTFSLFAKIVTTDQKFEYPDESQYYKFLKNGNMTGADKIFTLKDNTYAQHLHFEI